MWATSPVCSQPSRSVSAVCSGRLQYPSMTCGPRMQSSPVCPRGTSTSSGVEDADVHPGRRLASREQVVGVVLVAPQDERRVRRLGLGVDLEEDRPEDVDRLMQPLGLIGAAP